MNKATTATLILMSLFLYGCGGGDGDSSSPTLPGSEQTDNDSNNSDTDTGDTTNPDTDDSTDSDDTDNTGDDSSNNGGGTNTGGDDSDDSNDSTDPEPDPDTGDSAGGDDSDGGTVDPEPEPDTGAGDESDAGDNTGDDNTDTDNGNTDDGNTDDGSVTDPEPEPDTGEGDDNTDDNTDGDTGDNTGDDSDTTDPEPDPVDPTEEAKAAVLAKFNSDVNYLYGQQQCEWVDTNFDVELSFFAIEFLMAEEMAPQNEISGVLCNEYMEPNGLDIRSKTATDVVESQTLTLNGGSLEIDAGIVFENSTFTVDSSVYQIYGLKAASGTYDGVTLLLNVSNKADGSTHEVFINTHQTNTLHNGSASSLKDAGQLVAKEVSSSAGSGAVIDVSSQVSVTFDQGNQTLVELWNPSLESALNSIDLSDDNNIEFEQALNYWCEFNVSLNESKVPLRYSSQNINGYSAYAGQIDFYDAEGTRYIIRDMELSSSNPTNSVLSNVVVKANIANLDLLVSGESGLQYTFNCM